MLFATAVLSFLLITASAQEQECHLAKWLKELYMKWLNEKLEEHTLAWVPRPLLKWNKAFSDLALQEARANESHPGLYNNDYYTVLQLEQEFPKIDRLSVKQKVRKTLRNGHFTSRMSPDIGYIGGNAYVGCNGKGEEKDDKEYMKVICFLEKRLYILTPNGTAHLSIRP
ncbi:hypothetical protein GCK32_004693 [Trichostrongylus colubriformis]|uniref:Uncharacterized protein n=1 Tax=Trichostrongylus colubriformis TaxID=6319 RepID=A0AAN8G3Y2_TRICO